MGDSITNQTVYFTQKGRENTEELARIVADRVKKGDISAVAVATTSGFSALTVAEALHATGTSATYHYKLRFHLLSSHSHAPPGKEIPAHASRY